MNKYLKTPSTHWVVVESTNKFHHEWEDKLSPFYTFHKLKLMFFGEFEYPVKSGWDRQQILKLSISKYIRGEYYLVLDCKNFFIRDTIFTFDKEEGNYWVDTYDHTIGVLGYDDGTYDKVKNTIINYLKKPLPEKIWRVITPFRMRTEVSKTIVDTLNLSYMAHMRIIFLEFILYRLFTDYDIKNSENKVLEQFSQTFWDEVTNWRSINHTLNFNLNITMLAVHKKFIWNPNRAEECQTIKDFLYSNTNLDKTLIDNYFLIKY
jgi:hypothetical protein